MTPTNPAAPPAAQDAGERQAQCEHLNYFISDKRIAHCQVCGECGVLSEVTGVLWGREYLPPEERKRQAVIERAREVRQYLIGENYNVDWLDALLEMAIKPPAPSTPAPARSEPHPTPAGTPRAPEACRSAPSSPA
jgi:hypothetical protein